MEKLSRTVNLLLKKFFNGKILWFEDLRFSKDYGIFNGYKDKICVCLNNLLCCCLNGEINLRMNSKQSQWIGLLAHMTFS